MTSIAFTAPGAFKNRTVLITGGGGAIGGALAKAFAGAGANIVVNDLPAREGPASDGPAQRVVQEITSIGGSAIAVTESILEGEKLVAAALDKFGRLDVIVTCAGIEETKPFEEHTLDDFRKVIEVNTLGAVSPILAAWPTFKKQKYGRVINIVSDTLFGTKALSAYIFSKGAVLTGTRALSVEGEEHNILVNAIAPIAASPMAFKHIEGLDPAVKAGYAKALTEKFPPDSNVPMVLALAHESNTINGESFSVGAWSVSRIVLGFSEGINGVHTMEECLERKANIINKMKIVKLPKSTEEHAKMTTRGRD